MDRYTLISAGPFEFDDEMTEAPEEREVRMVVEENRVLKAENSKLMSELEEATLSMLDTAHRQDDTSDVGLRDEYKDLCATIDAWAIRTTAGFRKVDFRRRLEEVFSRAHHHRRDSRSPLLDVLSGIPSYLSINELSKSDNFSCLILSREIIRWLSANVLTHSYPIGVTTEQQKVLEKIEEGMELLRKDSSSIAQWRSQAIRGLVAHQSFNTMRERYAEEILEKGLDAVSLWLPTRNPFPDKGAKFRDTFLEPALELHRAMRTSTTQYAPLNFDEPRVPNDPTQHVTFRDLTTWGNVQNTRDIQASLGVLYPALSRLDAHGKVEEVLAGPVIVVTLNAALLGTGNALQRRYSTTTPHDDGKTEHGRPNAESKPGLTHSESEASLAWRHHDASISVARVGTETILVRRKTNDGKNTSKSSSGTNESPDRKSQRPKSGFWAWN